MRKKIFNIIGCILIMISILCFLYPEISSSFDDIRSDKVITDIQKYPKKKKAQLYQKASEYNQKIYESGQNELKDVWSYRSAPIKLTKGQKTFGYVQIPKMKVKLPLYLGATMENLRRGAAIMGQTSLPLGQVNGNCVIAAHRGYQGIPYFRDIERLKIGDKVYLRNPWKKMKYRVQKIQIIDPYDTDKIKIQKGKDMITLLTCHPYRGHGKYRYLVYCVRDHGQKIKKKTKKTSFLSSEKDIEKEIFMRYIGLFMICLVGFGMILRRRRWKQLKKKIKKRGKIVATLITVISFAAALTWYQMQNAYAYEHGTESKSTTLSKGYADVIIHGPNNKEEWINVEFFYSGKKMSQDKFNNSGHNITVKRKDGERSGVYSANVPTQTVTTSANGSGNYTRIKFNVEYWQPEHEEYSWESADSVSADYLSPKYQKASSDFQSQSWHGAEGRKVTVSVEMSIYAVGICTYNYKGKYHKVWNTAVHLGLQKPSRSVYYNTNGGTNHGDTWYFTDGDKFSFPSTERTGYTFDGWRKNNGSGDWVDTNDIVCGGNYTVAAQWTANTYSISYDAGDGDGDMSETSATYNKTVTLSQNKFTRKGYKFLGWSLKNDGSSVDYQNGASFTYDKADDITLYAVWEKDNYEVKFHGNGSSATDYTRNLPYNKTTNLPENVFERPGYTFMGWAPEEELDRYKVIPKYTNGAEVKDLCEPGETCNLYAIWRKTDGSFETKNIIHDDKMFFGDVNITGGNGTEYDQGMYDSKAAKIDKENDPGYFTDRYKKED